MNCVTWNPNNKLLATAGDDGRIVLSSSETTECVKVLSDDPSAKVNSLAFSSKSDLLATGEGSGAVKVWDLRKQEVKFAFYEHSEAVSQVVWNAFEGQLASGSMSGEIILHSLMTGISIANFKQRNSSGIKLLQFSPFKKQILAAASENGSVYLWDCSARSVTASFQNYHHSPVTGLAFSAVSSVLMCTSGLDQRIQFYDLNERKVVKSLETETPLTSLSFYTDGYTLAAGTLYGTIQLYDLRKSSAPKLILRGHEGTSVSWLEFAKKQTSEAEAKPPPAAPVAAKSGMASEATSLNTSYAESVREARTPSRFRTIEEIKQQARLKVEMSRRDRMNNLQPTNTQEEGPLRTVARSVDLTTDKKPAEVPLPSGLKLHKHTESALARSQSMQEEPKEVVEHSPVKKASESPHAMAEDAKAHEGDHEGTLTRSQLLLIEQRLDKQEEVMYTFQEDIQNFHIELIRQFTIQQVLSHQIE